MAFEFQNPEQTSCQKRKYRYIFHDKAESSFSIWNYIFINPNWEESKLRAIDWHERCHVDQKHTIDLLFIELLLILQWFNPILYFFKKRLVETHEYLADQSVLNRGYSSLNYQELLLQTASQLPIAVTNHFNSPQIKKRLIMVMKKKDDKVQVLKLLIIAGIVCCIILGNSYSKDLPTHSIEELKITKSENEMMNESCEEPPNFIYPIRKEDMESLTSGYGMRLHPITKKRVLHTGIDIAAMDGTQVLASAKGEVVTSEYEKNWGNYIIIHHEDGFLTAYGHLSKRLVNKGDQVKQGFVIAEVGSTGVSKGPHLHFEIGKVGQKREDPMLYLSKK